jgi:hypothetical protein
MEYADAVTAVHSYDVTTRDFGFQALCILTKRSGAVDTALLRDVIPKHIHEPFAFHWLKVCSKYVDAAVLSSVIATVHPDAITIYAGPGQSLTKRRWFWKLAAVAWPSGGLPLTARACAPLWVCLLDDTLALSPTSVLKRLTAQLQIIMHAPAAWLDPFLLNYFMSVWLILSTDMERAPCTAQLYARTLTRVMEQDAVTCLPAQWAQHLYNNMCQTTPTLLLAYVHEELSSLNDNFMQPLIALNIVPELLRIAQCGLVRQAAAAVFCLSNYAAVESVWTQLREPNAVAILTQICNVDPLLQTEVMFLFKLLFLTFPDFMVNRLKTANWFAAVTAAGEAQNFSHIPKLACQFEDPVVLVSTPVASQIFQGLNVM